MLNYTINSHKNFVIFQKSSTFAPTNKKKQANIAEWSSW